jgi:hypothetical protein
LKSLGFKKTQRTFYRVPTPGIIQIVNLQKTGAFGPFTVNLGVFMEYVRSTLHPEGEPVSPNKVREGAAMFIPVSVNSAAAKISGGTYGIQLLLKYWPI